MSNEGLDIAIELDGYDLVDQLATGNYGTVHLGVQRRLNRFVAIKILDNELTNDENYVRQFVHEAKVAAQLTHPNIVQVYEVGLGISPHVFFAMELVDGEDVLKIMKKGKIKWRQAFEWMLKIAGGLEYGMKKKGMTHGDIKPANIMITSNGEVKLTDMGLACMAGESKNEDQAFTPWYAAPEVIDGSWKVGDPRTDMYCFGASLYHMITGRPVFDAEECEDILDMHLDKEVIDCNTLANIPDAASDFILKLLEKDPDQRFESWRQVISKMENLLSDESLSKTHSGSRKSRILLDSQERKKEALKRLRRRRRRKLNTAKGYCYVAALFIVFLAFTDFIMAKDMSSSLIGKIAENFAGE